MVLPVSGFLPVPLPMMIPFMGAQSLVIGKMFGEGFQYGKRKISAMPNEEFNKLTFEDIMSNARTEMQNSIPTMQAALQDMKPMVQTVVHEFTNYLSLVISQAPKELGQVKQSLEDVSGFTALNDKLVQLIKDAKGTTQSQDVLGDILVALGLERFGDQPAGASDLAIPLTTTPQGLDALGKRKHKEQLIEQRQEQLAFIQSQEIKTVPVVPKRTSNQTIKIGIKQEISKISSLSRQLQNTPKSIIVTKWTFQSHGPNARGRRVLKKTQITNPLRAQLAAKIKVAQKRVIQLQRALR